MEGRGNKRFAVLQCAEDPEYVRRYGGYFPVYVEFLGDRGETWDLYRVVRGEFPPERPEVLEPYDGFVLTGSRSDAHGDEEWVIRLVSLLRTLSAMRKKVLGFCFGHQVLCRALGGKISRARSGWSIGVGTINLSSPCRFFSSLHIPSALKVIECHQDEVEDLPPGAEVLAWSDNTGIEMFVHGENIMGIQGHPEYTKGILLSIIARLLQERIILMSHANAALESLENEKPNREAWKRLCKGFLKGKQPKLYMRM